MKKLKATSVLDCEVLLAEVLGGAKYVERYLEIYKEKAKPYAIIRPKGGYIPNIPWKQVQRRVREMGGSWKRFERIWVVPLVEKSS